MGLQLGLAAFLSIPALLMLGACAAWVPLVGTLGGSFAWCLWRGKRDPAWLTRDRIRRLSVASGLVHGPLVALAYAGLWMAMPDAFSFQASALALLAPVLGVAGGFVALGLTLCGGDGAAAALGSWLPDVRSDG